MDTLLSIANWLLPLIYLALAIDYGATFILRTRTRARNPGIILAALAHAAFLTLWGVRFGGPPLANGYEVLSVIALSCTVVYAAIELATHDRRAGVFVFLLIFLLQYVSSAFLGCGIGGHGAAAAGAARGWARLHVLPACLAYTAMAFAAIYALLYLVGQRNLKQHRLGLLFDRLPPLELLGRMSWCALLGGLALMTLTMVSGAVFFSRGGAGGPSEALAHKVIAKIVIGSIAWAVCALAVGGRWVGKWSLSRVFRIAVAGSVVVVALFVTSAILSE